MKLSRLVFLLATAALAAAATSCRDAEPAPDLPARQVEVSICIPETRTALDDDGLSTRWEKGDRMALWAYKDGAAAFSGAQFVHYGSKPGTKGEALFTGSVPAMQPGTYTYYAASPVPARAEGTRVSYDLPAVQDGAWHGEWDVLLARASAPELKENGNEASDINPLDLRFGHKIHAVKVTIPAGRNRFGRPVKRLRVEFPRPVVGRLTWDLAAQDDAPSIEPVSNAVTLEFARPVGEGDSFWLFIAPGDMTGGAVRFTATDGSDYSWPIETAAFRNCAAGEITTVTLTVPALRPQIDYRLTVDPAQLGEAVTEIGAVELPEGYCFPSLDLALRRAERLRANGDGTFSLRIFEDMSGDFPAELGLTVGSANTTGVVGELGSGQCTVRSVTASGCTVKAPYLFFENFGGVAANDQSADGDGSSASELAPAGLPGWTGTRWKTAAGVSLEFRTYIGSSTVIGRQDNKYSRVDSAPLSVIRSGKTLNCTVQYDLGGSTNASRGVPRCIFGTTTQSGAIAAGRGYDNQKYPENRIDEFDTSGSGSPTQLPMHKSSRISATDATRLTWFGEYRFTGSGLQTLTAKTFYFYLDNVRVTIVQ